MAEGVELSKAALWLWSKSFASNPCAPRPTSRTAFESPERQRTAGDTSVQKRNTLELAEGVGFEPTVGCPTLDFESSALNRTQPPFLLVRSTITSGAMRVNYEMRRGVCKWANQSGFNPSLQARLKGEFRDVLRRPSGVDAISG